MRHNHFINSEFTEKQQSNYSKLVLLTNLSFFFLVLGFILPFFGVTLWTLPIAIAQKLIINSLTFRCVNCFSMKFSQTSEEITQHGKFGLKRSPLMVLYIRTYQCKNCGFEWASLKEKTGNVEGIAQLGRDRRKEKAIKDYKRAKEKENSGGFKF